MRRRLLSKPQTAPGISPIAPRVQGYTAGRRSTQKLTRLITFEALLRR